MPDGHTTTAGPGHNAPPPYREDVVSAHDAKAAEFLDAAGEWLEMGEIPDETAAGQLADFITGTKKVMKAVDEDRKADKKPHDDAGKAVQAAYTPIIAKLKAAVERVTPMQTAWLERVEAERKAEADRIEAEARKAAEEAERQAAGARSRNDVAGEVETEDARKAAEEKAKEADKMRRQRPQAKSATGGGRTASLRTNLRAAFIAFQDEPDLLECLRKLAERRARSKDFDPERDEIPGCNVITERKAV